MICNFKLLLCILGLLFSVTTLGEPSYNDKTCNLTRHDGLAGESVAKIITDHQGLVWLATSNGVSMFNGKQLIEIPIQSEEKTAIYVHDICEDNHDNIYIATKKGAFILKSNTNEFVPVCKGISRCEAIAADKDAIYIGNRSGLHIFKDGKHRTITIGTTPMGIENSVRDIQKVNNGDIWFATRYAVNIYFPRTGKTKTWNIAKYMPERAALSCIAIKKNTLFVGTKNDGLFICDIIKHTVNAIPKIGNVVSDLNITNKGELCVSCDGAGAFLLNTKGQLLQQYNTETKQMKLPTNSIYCYYRDCHGIDWLGMFRHGLLYRFHTIPLFHTYHFGNFSSDGLDVSSFSIFGTEYLMGTQNGLIYINENKNKIINVTAQALGGRIIKAIERFGDKYYIGLFDGGLRIFDPHTGIISKLTGNKLLNNICVASLKVSPDNKLWIGTSEGVFILDRLGALKQYTENNAQLMGGSISSICFSHNGIAWVCGANGMSLYSPVSHQFENTNFPANFFNSEAFFNANIGHGGMLLFNTGEHIYYTNPSMTKFGMVQLPSEPTKEKYYGLIDDRLGHYWFSTESGLFRVNYQMSDLLHFGAGEGLQCEFINSCMEIDKRQRLWIGTNNGLMWVNLQQMSRWQQMSGYHVMLYDIQFGGENVPLSESYQINEKSKIFVKWNFGSSRLSFKLLLNDFSQSNGRYYEYRLDHHKWQMIPDGQELSLTNFMPGSHQLMVRLAGVSGSEHAYRIIILPSWLAVIEILFIIGSMVLLLLWYRFHRNTKALMKERNEIEDALIEVMDEQQKKEENTEADDTSVPSIDDTHKYQRVKVNEEECKGIVLQMNHILVDSRAYINPDLKMSEIAEQLHLSPSKLSQVFNLYIKANYYEYINRYRLEEFKLLIDKGEYKRYTLTALSEKCGFKKSSFFSTFRKIEGMTPTEYLKKKGVKL